MGAPEQLAKLNPKSCRFDTGSGGGVPDLTWENMAGALGMCSVDSATAARAILLQDAQAIRLLVGRLMGVTMRWQMTMEQRYALVIRIVREEIHPDHCATCGGRGEAMIGDLREVCPSCHGSGLKKSTWTQIEAPAADAVSAVISGWLSEAMGHVSNELHDPLDMCY